MFVIPISIGTAILLFVVLPLALLFLSGALVLVCTLIALPFKLIGQLWERIVELSPTLQHWQDKRTEAMARLNAKLIADEAARNHARVEANRANYRAKYEREYSRRYLPTCKGQGRAPLPLVAWLRAETDKKWVLSDQERWGKS